MGDNDEIPCFEIIESSNILENRHSSSSSRIPKSWIIAALLFYVASVVTVGLLSGLLPRRIQHITILATPTPSISNTTLSPDPSQCIDDECNPRLLSDIIVEKYQLEYLYNNTNQTTIQGEVIIEFILKQPIKQLIYHSKRMLKLESPELYEDNVCRTVLMRLYKPNDYISLYRTSNDSFSPNKYILKQKFLVNLIDGNVGFYQNIYKDGNDINQ